MLLQQYKCTLQLTHVYIIIFKAYDVTGVLAINVLATLLAINVGTSLQPRNFGVRDVSIYGDNAVQLKLSTLIIALAKINFLHNSRLTQTVEQCLPLILICSQLTSTRRWRQRAVAKASYYRPSACQQLWR